MKRGLRIVAAVLAVPSWALAQELVGIAFLPSETYMAGPTSGQFIGAANGIEPPFVERQPVMGFSALLHEGGSTFRVLADNGYGAQENSADFVLGGAQVVVDFRTPDGGGGAVEIDSTYVLCDPYGHIEFPIVADEEFYPGAVDSIPVDARVVNNRLLTGADFDVESFRRVRDGTYWYGDEFGPFLLHSDAAGRLVGPPISLPALQSPQNPGLSPHPPVVSRSGGIEALALSADSTRLFVALERPLHGDPPDRLRIYEFALSLERFTRGRAHRMYRLEEPEHSLSELTGIGGGRFLAIERDEREGREAEFKRVFLVDFAVADSADRLVKREVLDLLEIPDPHRLASKSPTYRYAYVTIEALAVVDERTVCIVNDNNFPGSPSLRSRAPAPQETVFLLIRFEQPLAEWRVERGG